MFKESAPFVPGTRGSYDFVTAQPICLRLGRILDRKSTGFPEIQKAYDFSTVFLEFQCGDRMAKMALRESHFGQ